MCSIEASSCKGMHSHKVLLTLITLREACSAFLTCPITVISTPGWNELPLNVMHVLSILAVSIHVCLHTPKRRLTNWIEMPALRLLAGTEGVD